MTAETRPWWQLPETRHERDQRLDREARAELKEASKVKPKPKPARVERWNRERIIVAIKRWVELYGVPPRTRDWNPAPSILVRLSEAEAAQIKKRWEAGDWPRYTVVHYHFGGFTAAVRAAGFDPHDGLTPHQRARRAAKTATTLDNSRVGA